MDFSLSHLASILPVELDIISIVKFIATIAVISLVFSLFARIVFGKRSGLTQAVSSAIGIIMIYVLTIVVDTFNPHGLAYFLSPLPFVDFVEDNMYLYPISHAPFIPLCSEILSMIALAFLVNLLNTWIPMGQHVASWSGLRFLTVILAMVLHYALTWALRTFLPGMLVTYAPMILLTVLIISLVLAALKLFLGLALAMVNPIFAALYAFFFSNSFGKQLSKAALTTGLLCGIVYALEHFGYSVISISVAALISYIPLIAALLLLWYLIGHFL